MVKTLAPMGSDDATELEGIATVAAEFYDLLSKIRPELGKLTPTERRVVRENLVVDSAVMMHGYAALMKDFNRQMPLEGSKKALSYWQERLQRFSKSHLYRFDGFEGDLFEKANPLWQTVGVVKPGRDGKLTVLNTGAAQSECARVLRQLVALDERPNNLKFLANR